MNPVAGVIWIPNEDETDWLDEGALVDPVVVGAIQVGETWLGPTWDPEGIGAIDVVGTAAQILVAIIACSLASVLYSGQRLKHWWIKRYNEGLDIRSFLQCTFFKKNCVPVHHIDSYNQLDHIH